MPREVDLFGLASRLGPRDVDDAHGVIDADGARARLRKCTFKFNRRKFLPDRVATLPTYLLYNPKPYVLLYIDTLVSPCVVETPDHPSKRVE